MTRWKPGDEVVVHCNQASYEDPEVHGLDPMAAPSQKIWGYETTWGSFAQFTKVQAQQLLPKPKALAWEECSSYGLTYFTAYRMLFVTGGMGSEGPPDFSRSSTFFFVAFFLPAMVRLGPLRVRALVLVRCPRAGRPRRCRSPR